MSHEIALLHATRGRKEMFHQACEWWFDLADKRERLEHVVCMDEDDPVGIELIEQAIPSPAWQKFVVGPADQLNHGAWQRAYEHSAADVIVQMSDDVEPCQGWDTKLLDLIDANGGSAVPLAVAPQEKFNGTIPPELAYFCCYMGTRAYFKAMGYFMTPGYFSMRSDNDFAQKAACDGVLVDGWPVGVVLNHHWHGAPNDPLCDETYRGHHYERHDVWGDFYYASRVAGGMPHLKPVWQDIPWREAYFHAWHEYAARNPRNQHWAIARDGIDELLHKYHYRYCDGGFQARALCMLWNICTDYINDTATRLDWRVRP